MRKNEKKYPKLPFITFFILILFACLAPLIFTQPSHFSIFDFTDTGPIGDTINGIMGPFIAIAAALLTYFAFYEQIKANNLQKEATEAQIKKDEISNFENKLFQMIDFHRRNVSELNFDRVYNGKQEKFSGLDAIEAINQTISIVTFLLTIKPNTKKYYSIEEIQILSYLIVTHGNTLSNNKWFKEQQNFTKYAEHKEIIDEVINEIDRMLKIGSYQNENKKELDEFKDTLNNKIFSKVLYIDSNKMNVLSRYFRQIFQIYSFIDKQEILNTKQKYEYAKIFRTNITNVEQELMFYNIISPFGDIWHKKDYIQKYKPFKNISFYNMYGYSPINFLKDHYHISDEDLPNFLDVLSFDYKVKTTE